MPIDWLGTVREQVSGEYGWPELSTNLFSQRCRRVHVHGGRRVHIELRDLAPGEFEQFADQLADGLERLDGVEAYHINGPLRRVVVGYRSALTSPRCLVGLVEGIEAATGCDEQPFRGDPTDMPGDLEPLGRTLVEMTADTLAVATGTTMRLCGIRPSRLGFDVAALMAVVDETPWIRGRLESRVGQAVADVVYGTVNAFVQAVGSGPIGPLVDLIHQGVVLRGRAARKEVWEAAEPQLFHGPDEPVRPPVPNRSRPRDLPDGAIEEYADEAWLASLGGFIVGLADTHELESSMAPLFGGLPKAARYGRNGFCAELTRVLAERGIIPLRPDCLVRLDRIDCVVVDVGLLTTGELMTGRIEVSAGEERRVMAKLREMFDLQSPETLHQSGEWRLEPAAVVERELPTEVHRRVEEMRVGRLPVLVLSEGNHVRALVELRPNVDPAAEQLYSAARRAGIEFVIAADDPGAASLLPSDRLLEADRLADAVVELQRDGYGVAVVGPRAPEAMGVADLSVGVGVGHGLTAWESDLLCVDGVEDVSFVLEACAMASEVAEQSVVLAAVGATLGAFMSLRGLETTEPGQIKGAVNAVAVASLANGIRRAVELDRRPRAARRDPTPWHALARQEVLARLETSREGLARRAVDARPPAGRDERTRELFVTEAIADELINPLTPVLGAGAAISAIVGSMTDAALVSVVIGFNAALSGVERYRSERAVAELEERERIPVRVWRDGEVREVDADALVVGDVVELEAGDVVPADCRLLEADGLEVDQSSITGESVPVEKQVRPSFSAAVADRSSMVYDGTSIAAGRATAVVVAVGAQTEARRTFREIKRTDAEIGLEYQLRALTEVTIPTAGWASGALTLVGLMRRQNILELADTSVGMAVAAVPEGLPLLSTAAQMATSRRLSRHAALVRNPRVLEALGRVDVVCADKTGTLTEGNIELYAVGDGRRVSVLGDELEPWERRVLVAARRAGPAGGDERFPHPTDRAVDRGAHSLGVEVDEGVEAWVRVDAVPFEPSRGYYAVLGRRDGTPFIEVKGAPEVVIGGCDGYFRDGEYVEFDESTRAAIDREAHALAAEGLRVLAVAEKRAEGRGDLDGFETLDGFAFVGFVALQDPPRRTSKQAVEQLARAGVETLMITGDHPTTARRIAEDVGLLDGREVMTGADVETLDDDELADRLERVGVIARASPSQKGRIVGALQAHDRVVAMTGDGANDAGAIRLADIGIALGEDATKAAREAADLIVGDERIETIVRAIGEGRAMVRSVEQAAAVLTGGNFGEIAFTLLGGLLSSDPPLNARQLLLVNLLTDVAPAMAIALKPPSDAQIDRFLDAQPEAPFGEKLERDISTRALWTAGTATAAWGLARCLPGGAERASTVGLLALVGSQLGQTVAIDNPTWETMLAGFGSTVLLLGITVTPGVSELFGCRPIGPLGVTIGVGSAAATTGLGVLAERVVQRGPEWAERARRWVFNRAG